MALNFPILLVTMRGTDAERAVQNLVAMSAFISEASKDEERMESGCFAAPLSVYLSLQN